MTKHRVHLVLLCLFLPAVFLSAQTTVPTESAKTPQAARVANGGTVRGTVKDDTGAVIPNAQVTIHSAETDFQRSLSSGAGGEYEFLQLKPGVYKLSVSAPGFERYENPSLHLLVNTPATLNVALTLGKQTDVVSVSEEAPQVSVVNPQSERRGIPRGVAVIMVVAALVAGFLLGYAVAQAS